MLCSKIRGNLDLVRLEVALFESDDVDAVRQILINKYEEEKNGMKQRWSELVSDNFHNLKKFETSSVQEKMFWIYENLD